MTKDKAKDSRYFNKKNMFRKKPEFVTSATSLYDFEDQRRIDRENLLGSTV